DDVVSHPDEGHLQQGDDPRLLGLHRDPLRRPPEEADREHGDRHQEDLVGGETPSRQLVVEEVFDDVLGRQDRHTALRVPPSDRSTRSISTPRYTKKKRRNVRAKAAGSTDPVRRKRIIRPATTKSRAMNPPASVAMADFI